MSNKEVPTKITKKLRFEVFKRDGFACQYCGKTPPSVTLEVDHINPKSKGGNNDINNLITACFDCNRGKKNIPLTKIPGTLRDNLEVLKEQENQLKEYNKFINIIDRRYKEEAKEVNSIYHKHHPKWYLNESFLNTSLRDFQKLLPLHIIKDAMESACYRIKNSNQVINYFCGICWQKIRENDPEYKQIRVLCWYCKKEWVVDRNKSMPYKANICYFPCNNCIKDHPRDKPEYWNEKGKARINF